MASQHHEDNLIVTIGTLEVLLGTKFTVWKLEQSRLSISYGLMAEHHRTAARRLWKRHATTLRAGQAVRDEGFTLVPIVHHELVGLAQVPGEPRELADWLKPLVPAAFGYLAHALVRPDVPPIELLAAARATAGADAPPQAAYADEEVNAATQRLRAAARRQLVVQLDSNAWNVSETARQLHCSRTTLLERMSNLSITRPNPAPTDPRAKRTRTPHADGVPLDPLPTRS